MLLLTEPHRSWLQERQRREITRPEVLTGRFRQFFSEVGVDPEKAVPFNEKYQIRLGDTIVFRDDSKTIIESLKGRLRQYVVSNGTVIAQTKKLKLSGLGELMDGIFLSEQMGIEKPNKAFFDKAFAIMKKDHPEEALHPDEILSVGDSLTSDMRGGNNAGIRTCWYNPGHAVNTSGARVDLEIDDLRALPGLLLPEGGMEK